MRTMESSLFELAEPMSAKKPKKKWAHDAQWWKKQSHEERIDSITQREKQEEKRVQTKYNNCRWKLKASPKKRKKT